MNNRITLSPSADSEAIKLAILRVLSDMDKAMTATEIVEAIDHAPDYDNRIRYRVYNLEKNAKALIKANSNSSIKRYKLTRYGREYLERNSEYVPSPAQPMTPPPEPTGKKRLVYIDKNLYKLAKEQKLKLTDFFLLIWGLSQMNNDNFKFSDQGAATMLRCSRNTIYNARKELEARKLLYTKHIREGGKFNGSKWIFFDKPTDLQEIPQEDKPSEQLPKQQDDENLPF